MWLRLATHVALACAALLSVMAAEPALAAPASTSCDRQCQISTMKALVTAFVAHDPHKAPLAPDVRYTENGQVLALSDGFWGTASAVGGYQHYFTDPKSGDVGYFGTMRENGDLVLVSLRIRIADRQITQIEAIVDRPDPKGGTLAKGPAQLDALGGPNPIWDQPIPPDQRMSRDALIATANMYFSAIQENDGKGIYPFTDDCYRLEDGFQTTGPSPISRTNPPPPRPGQSDAVSGPVPDWAQRGCKAQLELGWMRFVDRIRGRRFLAVDPKYGTVFAMGFFDHSGTIHNFEMTNGERIVDGGLKEPWTWEIAEAFRIEKGKIRLIEAVLTRAPYGMAANWPLQPPFSDGALGGSGY